MPKFDAGAVIERLDYTFEPFHPDHGTVPEPNDVQVGDFLEGLKELLTKYGSLAGEVDTSDPAAMLDALGQLAGGAYVDAMHKVCDLFGGLCSGKPSSQTLQEVPLRPRQLFMQWLQGEVMAPEAVTAGGNAQVTTLRTAAGG